MFTNTLKRIILTFVGLGALTLAIPSEQANASPRCNTYRFTNVQPAARSIPYVQYRACKRFGRKKYYIRVFGKCHPTNCNWGWRRAKPIAGLPRNGFLVRYNQGFVKRTINFKFGPYKRMKMKIRSVYNDGRGTKVWYLKFRR